MPAKTEPQKIEIILKDTRIVPAGKGHSAVILGYGENQYFSKYFKFESEAKKALEGLLELQNKKITLSYHMNGDFKNWDKWEPLKTTSPPPATKPPQKEPTQEELKLKEEKAKDGILEEYRKNRIKEFSECLSDALKVVWSGVISVEDKKEAHDLTMRIANAFYIQLREDKRNKR